MFSNAMMNFTRPSIRDGDSGTPGSLVPQEHLLSLQLQPQILVGFCVSWKKTTVVFGGERKACLPRVAQRISLCRQLRNRAVTARLQCIMNLEYFPLEISFGSSEMFSYEDAPAKNSEGKCVSSGVFQRDINISEETLYIPSTVFFSFSLKSSVCSVPLWSWRTCCCKRFRSIVH